METTKSNTKKKINWIRIIIPICLIVIISNISITSYLEHLALPTPHKTIWENPPYKEINFKLSGKVYFPDGKPAPGSNVIVLMDVGKGGKILEENVKTDSNGYWEFHKVSYRVSTYTTELIKSFPNDYMVIAKHPGYGFNGFYYRSTTSMETSAIFLTPEQPFLGKVTDELGQPLKKVEVYIYSIDIFSQGKVHGFTFNYHLNKYPEFEWLYTITNEKGEFSFIGLPVVKNTIIQVTKEGYRFTKMDPIEENKKVNFEMEKMFIPQIRVLSKDNQKPLPQVLVYLDYINWISDSNGFVGSSSWFRKGTYWAKVVSPGLKSDVVSFSLNRENPSPEITLYAEKIQK